MKRFLNITISLMLIFLLVLTSGCGVSIKKVALTGEVVQKEYTEIDGSKVVVKNIRIASLLGDKQVEVDFLNSQEKKIVVSAQESFFDYFSAKSNDGKIVLEAGILDKYDTESIKIVLYGYKLESFELANVKGKIELSAMEKDTLIDASGASNITVESFNGTRAEVEASGASVVQFNNITTDILRAEISGASKIVALNSTINHVDTYLSGASNGLFDGEAQKLTSKISGASTQDSTGLKTENVKVGVSGSSTCRVNASKELRYSISGSSILKYSGNANVYEDSKSGSSIVSKIN